MKSTLNKDDKMKAIKDGVSEAFGFDCFMQTNIWANPEIRSQILKSIREGVKDAFTDFLEDKD